MAKGRKTGGRRPGSVNKTTASTKAALIEAFEKLGGVPSLVAWGKREPGEFYKLWSKLIPIDIATDGVSLVGGVIILPAPVEPS